MFISNLLQGLKIVINLQFRNAYVRLYGINTSEIKKAYNCEENIYIHNHFYYQS